MAGQAEDPELGLEGVDLEVARFLASYHDELVDGLDTKDAERLLESRPDLARELETELEVMDLLEALVDLDFTGRVFGDFRLIRELGRGATGIVYEAYQTSLARHVALKILLPGLIRDPSALGRFLRGSKLAASVSHPNVVGVFTAGVEGGMPYFAMEYAQGESLLALLERAKKGDGETDPVGVPLFSGGSADFTKVAEAFAGVAEGLQAIHSRGIIHRDLKPGNLLVEATGCLRILDFGLARLEGPTSLTMTLERLGTPLYMSPEQASGSQDLTARTDIFSLGATLYEVLASKPPFGGGNYQEILWKIIHRDAVFSRGTRIPPPLQRIVLKCLRKDPEARYGTAEALAQDLRRFVRGDPVEAEDEPVLERVRRRFWRLRWTLAKVAVAALLVTGLTLAGIRHSNAQRDAFSRRNVEYQGKVSDGVFLMQRQRLLTPPQNLLLAVPEPVSSPMESGAARAGDPTVSDTNLVYQAKSFRFRAGPSVADVESTLRSAVEELETAERFLPERPEAPYHLAMALQQLGDTERALERVDRALQLRPGFIPALALRAAILRSLRRSEASLAADLLRQTVNDPELAEAWIDAERAWFEQDWEKAEQAYDRLSANATWRESNTTLLDHRIRHALVRIKSEKYDRALEDIYASIHQWPGRLEPRLLLGKVQHLKGQQEDAARIFLVLHASTTDASKSDAAEAIAEAYRDLGDQRRALEWIDKMAPGLRGHLMRSEVLSNLGDHAGAVDAARLAFGLAPRDPDVLLALGNALLAGGDTAEARKSYDEAAVLRPEDTRPLVGRASCLEKDGNLDGARRIIAEALERDPRSGELHYNMGRLLAELGSREDAMDHYGSVPDHEPVAALAHLNLGAILDTEGRFNEALEEYERATELAPGLAVARYNLGWAYQREKNYKDAEPQYGRAIELGLKEPFVYVRHGMCLQQFRRYDDAVQAYDTALAIDSKDRRKNRVSTPERNVSTADIRHAKAHCHYHMGNYEMAVSEYRATLRLHPDRGVHLLNELGDCLEWTGAPEQAATSWRKTIQIEPKFIWAHNSLARVILQGRCRRRTFEEAEILRLEDAVGLHHASPALPMLLEEHRTAIAPRLDTFASVDAKLSEPDLLVGEGSSWKLQRGASNTFVGTEWTGAGFDDTAWEEGKGAFGLPDLPAVGTPLPAMEGYTSIQLRRSFRVDDRSRIRSVLLRIRCDGGYAVHLNGREVFRARAGVLEEDRGLQALSNEYTPAENGFWARDEVHLDPEALIQGENVLSLQGLGFPSDDGVDFRIDADLLALPTFDAAARRRAEEALEAFRGSAATAGDAVRIAYFEARLLQYSEDLPSALAVYRRVQALEPRRPEPVLRIAECLETMGDRQAAVQALEQAIESDLAEHDALWDVWFRLQADLPAETILARFPRLPPNRPDDIAQHPMEMRWLLEQLVSSHGAVRINCGGADHAGTDDKAWGRDRFYRGGIPFYLFPLEQIDASDARGAIYATERFFREHRRPVEGYRFPLPNGSYRLSLHFTEGWFEEKGQRVFDVLVQEKVFLERYEPPYHERDVKVLDRVEVTDGLLRIDFLRRVENPKITAIEIERL